MVHRGDCPGPGWLGSGECVDEPLGLGRVLHAVGVQDDDLDGTDAFDVPGPIPPESGENILLASAAVVVVAQDGQQCGAGVQDGGERPSGGRFEAGWVTVVIDQVAEQEQAVVRGDTVLRSRAVGVRVIAGTGCPDTAEGTSRDLDQGQGALAGRNELTASATAVTAPARSRSRAGGRRVMDIMVVTSY